MIDINLFTFCMQTSSLTNTVDKCYLLFCVYFWLPYQNSGVHRYVHRVWISNSIPLINMSDFMLMSCCFHYYSFVKQHEIRNGGSSCSSYLVQDCFNPSRLLFFLMRLRIDLSRSVKNCVRILIGSSLNL